MSPIERLLDWLWDRRGDRRAELEQREERTGAKLRRLRLAEKRAMDQVSRTQAFVRSHRGEYQ